MSSNNSNNLIHNPYASTNRRRRQRPSSSGGYSSSVAPATATTTSTTTSTTTTSHSSRLSSAPLAAAVAAPTSSQRRISQQQQQQQQPTQTPQGSTMMMANPQGRRRNSRNLTIVHNPYAKSSHKKKIATTQAPPNQSKKTTPSKRSYKDMRAQDEHICGSSFNHTNSRGPSQRIDDNGSNDSTPSKRLFGTTTPESAATTITATEVTKATRNGHSSSPADNVHGHPDNDFTDMGSMLDALPEYWGEAELVAETLQKLSLHESAEKKNGMHGIMMMDEGGIVSTTLGEPPPPPTNATTNNNNTQQPPQQCDELQQHALTLAERGHNLFLTGKAGTGKSWTTQRIVQSQKAQRNVHVTAPTGIAAINVNGCTIHSWGNFGLGEYHEDFDRMMETTNRKKICHADTLLIDEISMLNGHLLDVLECMVTIIRCYEEVKDRVKEIRAEAAAKENSNNNHVDRNGQRPPTQQDHDDDNHHTQFSPNAPKKNNPIMSDHMLKMRWVPAEDGGLGDLEPWGGLQFIVVGDFFQLPPVTRREAMGDANDDSAVLLENSELWEPRLLKVGRQGCYAFESRAWKKSNLQVIELNKVHRQAKKDGLFELLNDIREGKTDTLQQKHAKTLSSLCAPLPPRDDGIIPTELHSKNSKVDQINRRQLGNLPGDALVFCGLDEVQFSPVYKGRMLAKYGMSDIAHMPYLWACVERQPVPPELMEARSELHVMEQQKKNLLQQEDFEALVPLQKLVAAMQQKVSDMEAAEEAKTIISLSSIREWLIAEKKGGATNSEPNRVVVTQDDDNEDPEDIEDYAQVCLELVELFHGQLKQDYTALFNHAKKRFFNKECRIAARLELKPQAQVMLLQNVDLNKKLANGSRGIIIGFVTASDYRHLLQEQMKKAEKKYSANQQEGPQTPASRTIVDKEEKSDAQKEANSERQDSTKETTSHTYTSDSAIIQELKSFMEDVSVKGLQKYFEEAVSAMSANFKELPYVRFLDGHRRVIAPTKFQKEFKECGVATRWQIPLALAWAISIHKSQGMSIDHLRVDAKDCFAAGQAYVACSRGVSLDTMTVDNFHVQEIKTSEKAKRFYETLHTEKGYDLPLWSDTIDEFDANEMRRIRFEEKYRNKRCEDCGARCVVRQVKNNRNGNIGKWFVCCSAEYSHHFEFIKFDN